MASVTEAIIGMVGVMVGGGITTAGTVWAQRQQRKAGVAAEQRARETSASTIALDSLSQLLQLPDEPESEQAASAWRERRRSLLVVFGAAIQDIGNVELRHRLDEARSMLELFWAATNLTAQTEGRTRWIACGHALACLGAFRRGEPLPVRPEAYLRTSKSIDEWMSSNVNP